ncbi:DUF2779 domain-containing protein [Patescibacteria group bacterium]|nr:DUF2779 domain-containing protein [Patescibacteria group bacterium]
MFKITKTDYLDYTFCKKNLWLKKHKHELFDDVELSDFEKKIIEEGNLADAEAQNLFVDGVLVESVDNEAILDTKRLIDDGIETIFQGTFYEDDFFIRADIMNYNKSLGGWELYEVKASNDIKRKEPYHYVNDLAFQKTVIEKSGLKIVKSSVIHLNKEYRRGGEVDYRELFIFVDLSDEVVEQQVDVKKQMEEIKQYLGMDEEKGCECLYRGRNAQCTTFKYSNPEVPEYSVHDINRIGLSKKLFYDWIDRGIYSLDDIDNPEKLTGAKLAQYNAHKKGSAIIDRESIISELGKLVFPLYFFDYEGFVSAIPMFDGFGAYEQIPFQYSLHIMDEKGNIDHKEFLITDPKGDITLPLVKQMKEDIDPSGTVIAWYKTYEKQRNEKLAQLHPEYADFLNEINDKMYDLMHIFSKNYYVDPAFKGSSSIKKVLPVVVPDLSYSTMNISKGDQASERWEKMINKDTPKDEKEKIKKDLLDYCALDTMAMVRIYQRLLEIVKLK